MPYRFLEALNDGTPLDVYIGRYPKALQRRKAKVFSKVLVLPFIQNGEPLIYTLLETALYFVYVLRNSEGRLYIGFTTDLEKRVHQHQNDEAGWTRGRVPWELIYSESFADRAEALRREKNLKRGKQNQELRDRFSQEPGRAGPSAEGLTARL